MIVSEFHAQTYQDINIEKFFNIYNKTETGIKTTRYEEHGWKAFPFNKAKQSRYKPSFASAGDRTWIAGRPVRSQTL
jgi:hypothetical protein